MFEEVQNNDDHMPVDEDEGLYGEAGADDYQDQNQVDNNNGAFALGPNADQSNGQPSNQFMGQNFNASGAVNDDQRNLQEQEDD
jgi:hypothetical protein